MQLTHWNAVAAPGGGLLTSASTRGQDGGALSRRCSSSSIRRTALLACGLFTSLPETWRLSLAHTVTRQQSQHVAVARAWSSPSPERGQKESGGEGMPGSRTPPSPFPLSHPTPSIFPSNCSGIWRPSRRTRLPRHAFLPPPHARERSAGVRVHAHPPLQEERLFPESHHYPSLTQTHTHTQTSHIWTDTSGCQPNAELINGGHVVSLTPADTASNRPAEQNRRKCRLTSSHHEGLFCASVQVTHSQAPGCSFVLVGRIVGLDQIGRKKYNGCLEKVGPWQKSKWWRGGIHHNSLSHLVLTSTNVELNWWQKAKETSNSGYLSHWRERKKYLQTNSISLLQFKPEIAQILFFTYFYLCVLDEGCVCRGGILFSSVLTCLWSITVCLVWGGKKKKKLGGEEA